MVKMYEAELHCHTNHSKGTKLIHEGLNTPKEMVQQASRIGLSIMAITDHNKIKGALEAKKYARKYNVLVIPSEEVSTKDGHMVALGIQELIPPGLSLEESVDLVRQQGGAAIAAHPFDFRSEGSGDLAIKCDAVEVFNAFNIERVANNKCLGFVEKHNLPYVAGSDAHSIYMLGFGRTIFKKNDIDSVIKAGSKPCPPNILGVAIGGGADIAMKLAKKALLRPLNQSNLNPEIAQLEKELLEAANQTGIGPMGLGGKFTVLGVNVEYAARHPASYPAAVAFNCWAARRATARIHPDGRVEAPVFG